MTETKSNTLAIFGGSFDPIHLGHLQLAECIREEFRLEKIIFMPSGMPPHKILSASDSNEHRYQMILAATKSNPHFEVSRLELERQGYSYTVDTLTEMRRGLSGDTPLYFIAGADSLIEMQSWKSPEKLFAFTA